MPKCFLTKQALERTILLQIKALDEFNDVESVEVEFLDDSHLKINWNIKSITRSISDVSEASWLELQFTKQIVEAAYKQVSATYNLRPPLPL